MSTFWKNKNVSITGGNGFLGKHLTKALEIKKPKVYRLLNIKNMI